MLFAQSGALFGKVKIGGVVQVPLLAANIKLNLTVVLGSDVVLSSIVRDEFAETSWSFRCQLNRKSEVGLT